VFSAESDGHLLYSGCGCIRGSVNIANVSRQEGSPLSARQSLSRLQYFLIGRLQETRTKNLQMPISGIDWLLNQLPAMKKYLPGSIE